MTTLVTFVRNDRKPADDRALLRRTTAPSGVAEREAVAATGGTGGG